MMDTLKEWWDGLAVRERIYVGSGSVLLIVMLFSVVVILPVFRSVDNLQSSIPRLQEDLMWMKQAAASIKELERSQPGNKGRGNRSLLAIIDQSLSSSGIKPSVQKMEPDGRNSVKVSIKNGSFDQLITMFGELEQRDGIVVTGLSLNPTDTTGTIEARVTLSRGGS